MKIWHFILILVLVAVPSGATWLYLDSQRETEQAGLFGDIKANVASTPIPPIFWDDPIAVEPEATAPTPAQDITSSDAMERLKEEIFSDILEPASDPSPIVLPPVEEAIPNRISEREDSEEDVVAEP